MNIYKGTIGSEINLSGQSLDYSVYKSSDCEFTCDL